MSESIFEALSHPLRRKILQILSARPRTFSELMSELNVDSPTLAFHIKRLAGLITKDERGLYDLTEVGRRALKVLKEVKEAGESPPIPYTEEPLIFHDRVFLRIDNALLQLAKREKRKVRVDDVAIVEVDKDVDPGLFHEVVEGISDVAVLKVPDELRAYVEPKVKDVGLITGRGLLISALKLGVDVLSYLAPLRAFRRNRRELTEVYRGEVKHGGKVALEVSGGRTHISKGPNFIIAKCKDARDFDISEGLIRSAGCEVNASLENLEMLTMEVSGGYVDVENAVTNFKAEVTGGAVNVGLELRKGEFSAEVTGGAFAGSLKYAEFEGESRINLSATGGVVELELNLPPEIGVAAFTSAAGGVLKLPPSRAGRKGVVVISAEVVGGAVKVKLAE